MTLDALVDLATTEEPLPDAYVKEFCQQERISRFQLCDRFARRVARRYLDGGLDWQKGVWAMNHLFRIITACEIAPEFAWDAYHAFDEGENRSSGHDAFTKSMLSRLIIDAPGEELSEFEAWILWDIGSASHDRALQKQLVGLRVAARKHTGTGCYSRLIVREGAPATKEGYGLRGPLGGPCFESSAIEDGGGSLLWFKQGFLDELEIYSYGSRFPKNHAEITDFRLAHTNHVA